MCDYSAELECIGDDRMNTAIAITSIICATILLITIIQKR